MRIETIERFSDPRMDEYENFILANPKCFVYGTRKYLRFLRDVTGGSPVVFIARDGERIIGTLPALTLSTISGTCMNSLPWYGSNPGVLTDGDTYAGARRQLLEAFVAKAKDDGMISATVISNPTEPQEPYRAVFGECLPWAKRTGMISRLDLDAGRKGILDRAHQKTRNQILKALNSELRIDGGARYLTDIYHLHKTNMEAVNAKPKSQMAFRALEAHFEYGRDYLAQVTFNGAGVVCAGLVTLLTPRMAEYFIPGVDPDYRHLNPMHMLIVSAMEHAMSLDIPAWNWGGTRPDTQAGVYHFKERWGPEKSEYGYYFALTSLKAFAPLRGRDPEDIKDEFSGFFVAPFHHN